MCRKAALFLTAMLLMVVGTNSSLISAADPEPASESVPVRGDVSRATPAQTTPTPYPEPSVSEPSAQPPTEVTAPYDPCLPGLYTNWLEFSQDDAGKMSEFKWLRIEIDRLNFQLVLTGMRRDDSIEEIYRTHVALGDANSPTPQGRFIINHVYCYPDVVFFDASADRVPGLYNGFFAPLLVCDERGRCQRFRELGIHGLQAAAIPVGRHISPATVGAVSSGCIRLPDPCRFKKALIKAAGLGSMKQIDRGSYHWLKKPVEVVISDTPPDSEDLNLLSMFEHGVTQVQEGLKNLFDVFR
jgi:hypothetical protein